MDRVFAQGARLTIEWTEDAQTTLRQAESRVPGNHGACKAQMRALIKRLAETGKLRSPDHMRNEGDKIFAVKARCGLRAYGWYHRHRRGVFVISHFIMKKKDALDPQDLNRATRNRDSYEEAYP